MDLSNITKGFVPAVQAAPQRADAPLASGAVRTELPREAAVQQIEKAAPVQLALNAGAERRAALDAAMRQATERARARSRRLRRAEDADGDDAPPRMPSRSTALLGHSAYAQTARAIGTPDRDDGVS